MGFELPEVINLSKQMETHLIGKTINEIILGERCNNIITTLPQNNFIDSFTY